MSNTNTNQETSAGPSYISVAASITAKFKCCLSFSETNTTNENQSRNIEGACHRMVAGLGLETPSPPPQEDQDLDAPITMEEALRE